MSEKLQEIINYIVPILQKVAMGDFSQTIEISGQENEFTELLVALKLMIDDLKEATTKMDERVNKKTRELQEKIKELEKMNALMIGRELKMAELKQEIKSLKEKYEK